MKKKYSEGFNLVELLVGLSIASIVVTIAIPSMSGMISNTRMADYANNLHRSISLAKSEAIKRGIQVTVCISNSDQSDCDDSAGGWENGWIVKTSSGDEEPILIQAPFGNSVTLRSDSNNATTNIVFNPSGMTSNMGTLILCQDQAVDQYTKSIHLSRFGKVNVQSADYYTPSECYL